MLVFQHHRKSAYTEPASRYLHLSRRERQVMDVLYRETRASAAASSYARPARLLGRARPPARARGEGLRAIEGGLHYVYLPRSRAKKPRRPPATMRTFFNGSVEACSRSCPAGSCPELDRRPRHDKRRKEGKR
jgi:hypothetical protein